MAGCPTAFFASLALSAWLLEEWDPGHASSMQITFRCSIKHVKKIKNILAFLQCFFSTDYLSLGRMRFVLYFKYAHNILMLNDTRDILKICCRIQCFFDNFEPIKVIKSDLVWNINLSICTLVNFCMIWSTKQDEKKNYYAWTRQSMNLFLKFS